ncbi:component of SufBCD complex [Oceaniglobus ichthyenteri]|uniref:component of SufBCD complex n=1 Tax=Oceaniglobus ichthyenteri TaxID=2136177 RepID=UPI000D3AE94C|nr:component of SufBCD complex [Oceaniglobus ichthyenteri]
MNWYTAVFELIDMRSFSNLWYWIALATVWSTASHWVLGVPFDMVTRARRFGGQAEADLDTIARINVNRLLYIASVSGVGLVSLGSMLLSALGLLAFWYGVEFAQALFLIAFPMTGVWMLSLNTARLIAHEDALGEDLRVRLARHRMITQLIGIVSIFVTAMWGMYKNLDVGPLGG